MSSFEDLENYISEIGGVYTCDDLSAVPFNHWKQDMEWVIVVTDKSNAGFITARAHTAREACTLAFAKFLTENDEEEDDE